MNKIDYSVPENMSSYAIMQYQLISINKSIDEELENYYPAVFKKEINHYRTEDYYLIPCNNVGGNYLVIALEPQSQCGLIQYEEFSHLLNLKTYPILRVERFNE